MKKRILIFYISKFSGHFHAARAIEKGLMSVMESVKIEKINAFSYTNPILEKIINKAYTEVIKKKPEIWGNMYDNPEVMKKTQKARSALHHFNLAKIKKLLELHNPDVVFCTQAFPCGMVADYKRLCGKNIPLIGILTDHAPHSYWLFDEVNYYVVPFSETADILKKKGVSPDKIKVYGIPIDLKFSVLQEKLQIKKALGFRDDKNVVLLMGGSQGLGAMETVANVLLNHKKRDYQLIVVTGSNRKLYNRLKRMKIIERDKDVFVLPYVDNINDLMDAADIIITKAGGMTVAETLAKRLPMLIVDPIPGHERMNTDFLTAKGAAIEVKDYGN
ncbi:MAG: hypothetical protein KJ864_06790, partial [Candidatus Omnitrophica bacterium]|nr:hypothetical protein [Candidatus Omnitrophota bacterium]